MGVLTSKSVLKFVSGCTVFVLAVFIGLSFCYLKILPKAVSNPKVVSFVEQNLSKILETKVIIKNPKLITELKPNIYFETEYIKAGDFLIVKDLKTKLSLNNIHKNTLILKEIKAEYLWADINKISELSIFKIKKPKAKNKWTIDIFQSVMQVKKLQILYCLKKRTNIKINAKNIYIDKNPNLKKVKCNLESEIFSKKSKVSVNVSDNDGIYLHNKEKFVLKDAKIFVNNSLAQLNGEIDTKYNFDFNILGKSFELQTILDILNTQIIENNIDKQLEYFDKIKGNIDYNIHFTNKLYTGKIKLNKLTLDIVPVMNLPVLFKTGEIEFDNNKIKLKNIEGYYNTKLENKIKFEGTVDDYLKSIDTKITGSAIVTNDFAQNYLSKMVGYPVKIKGIAKTRIKLNSKYNKIDLLWLYMFKQGNGFVFDGEEPLLNDTATRVLAAKMHYENPLLNIESINYHAGKKGDNRSEVRIPILSMNGNIDFSNGKTFVKDFGLELTKPMPSGFINMLLKEQIFRNGTFTGKMKVINTGKYPVLKGKMNIEKVGIPSQRLFINQGEFNADNKDMHISANGRFRRSSYDMNAIIDNQIKFPIIVKDINLNLDSIDVEKYLEAFNQQKPTEAAEDVKSAVRQAVATDGDIDDDTEEQTFDLANIIVKNCVLSAKNGYYKGIKFANVIANLTLDKNSLLKINTNNFDIAEGTSNAKIDCDLKNHKYSMVLDVKDVDSDILATNLLNLSKEIAGKASGLLELETDNTLKLNGKIKFKVNNGIIGKIGLVEYVMKVASLFRNPLTMISPSVISDLVNVPEGKFDTIEGDLRIKDNIILPMIITSTAPQISSYIIGTYNMENQDASLRIYTKFSNRKKGVFGLFRNISLNALANRIPLSSRNDTNYYEAEIAKLPPIEADEKDCQIFLTKVDGDIEHNNFISSLKKIK